ncbi:MAG: hypothetical protein R2736_02500 [Solirubrobacterales bacterium]
MHRFWSAVIEPIIGALEPRVIVEMGPGDEIVAQRVAGAAAERDMVVHLVAHAAAGAADTLGDHVRVHHADPVAAAARVGEVDLLLLDADPNWHTVLGVLRAAEQRAAGADRLPPVIVVHDTRWPYGRRDGYADPDRIPERARQPSARDGVRPGHRDLDAGGWQTGLWNAVRDHGPRNGVRCAIDDFLAETATDWTLVDLPGLGGLAVLAPAQTLDANAGLARLVDELRGPRFLADQCRRLDLDRVRVELALDAARRDRQAGFDAERAALAAARQQLEEAQTALADLEAAALGADERQALTDALAAAERRADDAAARTRADQAQLARTTERLAEAERERAIAQARLQGGLEAAAAMEHELRDSRQGLEQRLAAAEAQLGDLRSSLARREAEVDDLCTRVEAEEQRARAASADVEQLRGLLARAEAETDREHDGRAGAERRVGALERELEARDRELSAARSQERLLADRAAELDQEARALRADLAAAERARARTPIAAPSWRRSARGSSSSWSVRAPHGHGVSGTGPPACCGA